VPSNLETAQQINKLILERKKLIQDSNKVLSRQAAIARELCKALDCDASDSLDEPHANRIVAAVHL